ncbi:hypothetical protein B0H14DRAFT_2701309 [Mycena olivaceomarginata]|nr:hypothetical protein B0H14DRAFT_2701309 [Mycena olivaceomarginata]
MEQTGLQLLCCSCLRWLSLDARLGGAGLGLILLTQLSHSLPDFRCCKHTNIPGCYHRGFHQHAAGVGGAITILRIGPLNGIT